MTKLLLFGSTGFIGKNVADQMNTNKSYELFIPTRAEVNLLDPIQTKEYIEHVKPNLILNCAYMGVDSRVTYTNDYLYNNLRIVSNIMEASRSIAEIKKMFFFGSSLEYKDSPKKLDEESPLQPQNVYATTKMLCSMLSLNLARQWELPLVLLRPFNLYGTYDTKSVIYYVINSCIQKKQCTVTKGTAIRDYMYVDDLKRIIENIIQAHESFNNYEAYNIATEQPVALKYIFEIIANKFQATENIIFKEHPQNEYWHNVADCSKLKKIIMLDQLTPLDAGLEKTIEWIKRNNLT